MLSTNGQTCYPLIYGLMLFIMQMKFLNTLPYHQDGASPLERFNNVAVSPKLRHFNAFGCPAYVLDNKLQGNQSLS